MADDARERVLRRSSEDRMIAGVAGGLARYVGVDAILLRIAFVALIFAGGGGLLLYALGWLFIPHEQPGDALTGAPRANQADAARWILGGALIVGGVALLVHGFFPWIAKVIWPAALIAVGAAILLRPRR